ncbi:hypothetical protein KC343_g13365 [Hortaea werneckii]|nr:hypothetical protein KC352_g14075 [Hortaea werneckii]KAI7566162.1 hypothetical protein KC317_g5852 [Hortaea werneckii]KAI7606574.1 hypothetical protein KC343_g13365 [Hortaea werneckii]KAI7617355.1 hypothetical protein KC346_g5522 [Hortaea werneckii]KAI7668015.1 hypothetical protein KC319_g6518 [Hortaea werneckii]
MAGMGNDYFYVTPTGPVFAGQGIDLYGMSQGAGVPASLQDAAIAPVDGSTEEFDYACAEIDVENGHPVLQQWAPQEPDFDTSRYGISDTGLDETDSGMADLPTDLSQSLFTTDYCEDADSPYDVLQNEQNSGATWVEGPPGGAPFGDLSASNMVDCDGNFSAISIGNSEAGLDFAQ